MRGRFAWLAGAILGVLLFLFWQQAHAVITAKTPLNAIAGSMSYIVVGKVEKFFPDKPAMLVAITEDIKGKAPFRQLPINCNVADEKAYKENKIEPLMKRFGPDLDIIFFLAPPRDDGSITTFGFTNGTWFQLHGTLVEKDKVVFSLHSAEPYFRKTYKGTTEELRDLLKKYVAKKAKLPAVDDKEEPGFGPEYAPKKGAQRHDRQETLRLYWGLIWHGASPHRSGGGPLFAVIPTIGHRRAAGDSRLVVSEHLRRRVRAVPPMDGVHHAAQLEQHAVAAASVACRAFAARQLVEHARIALVSHDDDHRRLRVLGLASAAQRPLRRRSRCSRRKKPNWLVLAFMSASCVATTIALWFLTDQIRWSDIAWTLTVVMTLGIVAGTLYRFWCAFHQPGPFGSMPLATEGVILSAMLLGHVAFVPAIFGGAVSGVGLLEGREQTGNLTGKVAPFKEKWIYTAPDNFLGMFASSPVVDGDAVYAAFSDALQRGTLVRLDRHTGEQKWAFYGKKPALRQMISTPCLADGKLYFGEGFHDDKDCHVFSVDAETGKEVWHFQTAGQTESSPAVAHGKVYIGAGNDGVYCLDAKSGAKIWHYPRPANARLQRFGGGMVVVGNRLYCGTGVDRNQKDRQRGNRRLLFRRRHRQAALEIRHAVPRLVHADPQGRLALRDLRQRRCLHRCAQPR